MPLKTQSPEAIIKYFLTEGTPEQKRALFSFSRANGNNELLVKFKLFVKTHYARYFKTESSDFHNEMILNMIRSYRGEKYINLAFRGSAKTTLAKLFLTFVLLNDEDHFRRYIKIMSRDDKNPKQIVTDVYNMCLEVDYIYGDLFARDNKVKREETMSSFTMRTGVKVTAGTVGQKQRGHLQDAYRPDWLWFDDIEDRESMTSQTITDGVIMRCDEAITGLSKGGSFMVTGNYITEYGSIQWFLDKKNAIVQITPIATELEIGEVQVILDGKSVTRKQIVSCVPTWDIFSLAEINGLFNDSEDFYGEYMCDPTHSDDKFFDIVRIEEDLKESEDPKSIEGEVNYWDYFVSHHRYGLGADTSEGVGRDSCALAVFNFKTGMLVATYDSNLIKPELFAYEIARVGGEYGQCVVAPEINNFSGGVVITTLKDIYPEDSIYRQVDKTKVQETESAKFGFHTNSRTKTDMFVDFRRDYNDGVMTIKDKRLLKEMKSFSKADLQQSGKPTTGKITRHFDLLIAAVIAWQMKDVLPNKRAVTVNYHD